MNKSYEFRIYPTPEQEILINKTIGCSRFIYNHLLEDCQNQYKELGKFKMKTPAFFKKEFEFLKEVDSLALSNAQMNLQTAYTNFFRNLKNKKKKVGAPKFHSKKNNKQSYKTNNVSNSIRIEKGMLKLPKLGYVKIKLHRYVEGKIKSVIIKRTPTNKYFVSILTESEIYFNKFKSPNIENPQAIGIDYSSHDFAVYSTGEIANPPHSYRKYEKKLRKEQRSFSRKQKDSKRREKQRIKVARIHEKISNIRKAFIEKESTKLINFYDAIILEDLNLQSISSKKGFKLGKSTYDNGFGSFRGKLNQKALIANKIIYKVPRFYASSQICSNCGYKNSEIKDLSIREWVCPECGEYHDRDINAAQNLVNYFLNKMNTSATDEIYAQGEEVRPLENNSKEASSWNCEKL